jgi:hypothetical protein
MPATLSVSRRSPFQSRTHAAMEMLRCVTYAVGTGVPSGRVVGAAAPGAALKERVLRDRLPVITPRIFEHAQRRVSP